MWSEFALPPLAMVTFALVIFLSSLELVRHRMARRKEAAVKVKSSKQQPSK